MKTKTTKNNRVSHLLNGSTANLVVADVSVTGIPPGLMFQSKGVTEEDERNGKPAKPRPPEVEAALRAHWTIVDGRKELSIPWVMFYLCFCKAAGKFKAPGRGRKTFEHILAPTLSCELEQIPLGISKFETFVDWVRIPPRTGGMVKIGRPLIKEWSCTIPVTVDCSEYDPEMLKKIVPEGGKYIGIGAFSPRLKGPYGRFVMTDFKIR